MKTLRLLLVIVALTGCPIDRNNDGKVTIACIGDSNTMTRWADPADTTTRWCERLATKYPAWTFRNYGFGGASTWSDVTYLSPYFNGRAQVAAAVADHADMVVIAFVTNDVAVWHRTPGEVVAGYATLRGMLPAGIPVGLIAPPPAPATVQAATQAAWAAVSAQWPGDTITPTMPANGMAADGVHLNDSGQAARATAVETWMLNH